MNILSLYDGMACGYISFKLAGVPIDRYDAYEIDKYAVQTAILNFPNIAEHGDVFEGDFTQYRGYDFLIGDSPCTYWSIAQSSDKRETTASGIGWDLFQQYVRALKEAEPKFFIYENNKSMAKAISESITETFGFEPIYINSALVSAQNRQRLYWVGRRNEDGTYSKVIVEQPEDRGILLKDILDSTIAYKMGGCCGKTDFSELSENELAYMVRDHQERRWSSLQKPYQDKKAKCVVANFSKGVPYNTCAEPVQFVTPLGEDEKGKSHTLTSSYYKAGDNPCSRYVEEANRPRVAEPVVVSDVNGKSSTLMANARHLRTHNCIANSFQKSTAVAEPVAFSMVGDLDSRKAGTSEKAYCLSANPSSDMTARCIEPIENTSKSGKLQTTKAQYQNTNVSCVCCYNSTYGASGAGEKVGYYAYPTEFDEQGIPIKAQSITDDKAYTVYEVKDGQITIKGKTYPIKLIDGYYIIRKLTVRECMRLQTVPEWYEFPVSNSQSYKMLGNGWTVEVIVHLIKSALNNNTEKASRYVKQSFFDMFDI